MSEDAEPPVPLRRDEPARPEWFVETPAAGLKGYEPGVVPVWRVIGAGVLALMAIGAIAFFVSQVGRHQGDPNVAIDFIALGMFVIAMGAACWALLTRR